MTQTSPAYKVRDVAGYPDVPIVTSGDEIRELHPGFRIDTRMQIKILLGLAVLDALEDMRRSTRPYELRAGDTEAVFDAGLRSVCEALPRGRKRTLQALGKVVDSFNRIPVTERASRCKCLVTAKGVPS